MYGVFKNLWGWKPIEKLKEVQDSSRLRYKKGDRINPSKAIYADQKLIGAYPYYPSLPGPNKSKKRTEDNQNS